MLGACAEPSVHASTYGPSVSIATAHVLDTLDCPRLILAGALDDKYVAITDEAAIRIDPARRVVTPEAGHNVHAERPSAFVDALDSFLADTA